MAKKNVQNYVQTVFSEVADDWLSGISLRIKPSSYAVYKAALDRHILPYFGNCDMQCLTAAIIGNFAKEKLANGRLDKKGGLSPKTVHDMLSIIKSILGYALDAGKMAHRIKVPYPKLHRQARRVFNMKEQKHLMSFLKKDIDIHKLGVLLCLHTGIRLGELCGLMWQDISLDQDMITVKRTMQRVKEFTGNGSKTKITVGPPKSPSSVRSIPIPKSLTKIMREHSIGKQGYFLATDKSDHTEPRTMQNHFARMLRRSDISKANFNTTRHTFATRCIEAGVDVKSLSEMLGHSDVNITLSRYVHSSFEQKRACIGKLERYIGA